MPFCSGCSGCSGKNRKSFRALVEVCAKTVPALVEPRTFVQCVLKEQHSHQTFGQWRRQQSDGQSGLPSTALDHVSATERSPMCYRRDRGCLLIPSTDRTPPAAGWHPATGGVERAIRQLIIGISYRISASWPSEPTRWPFAVAKATQVCTRNRTSPVAIEEPPSSRDPTTRPLRRSPRHL